MGKGGGLTNLLLHILKSERMANPASPSPSDGIRIQNLRGKRIILKGTTNMYVNEFNQKIRLHFKDL